MLHRLRGSVVKLRAEPPPPSLRVEGLGLRIPPERDLDLEQPGPKLQNKHRDIPDRFLSMLPKEVDDVQSAYTYSKPQKLETGLKPNSAGIPYILLLGVGAIGFPTFGLLL